MQSKPQWQVVVETLEKLGGLATLGHIIHYTLQQPEFRYSGKTPEANIRRIVQTRPKEIIKVRPGLYALASHRVDSASQEQNKAIARQENEFTHYYYQGLLLELGTLKKFETFVPAQDQHQKYLQRPLSSLRTLPKIPDFSYPKLTSRARTIDVIWFNKRGMPNSFFEVEKSTDMQNSLLKYQDLQDFHTRMFIVASKHRYNHYRQRISQSGFEAIRDRVTFMTYENLANQHAKQFALLEDNYVF